MDEEGREEAEKGEKWWGDGSGSVRDSKERGGARRVRDGHERGEKY